MTPKCVPSDTWQGLRQGEVQASLGLSPTIVCRPQHHPRLLTPRDSPTPLPHQVQVPAHPRALSLAANVCWVLPSQEFHLLLEIKMMDTMPTSPAGPGVPGELQGTHSRRASMSNGRTQSCESVDRAGPCSFMHVTLQVRSVPAAVSQIPSTHSYKWTLPPPPPPAPYPGQCCFHLYS